MSAGSELLKPFRIEGPSGEEIRTLDDWHRYAPPKKADIHWKPCRSAMELARAWLDDGSGPTLPREIGDLLESHCLTRDFTPSLAIPEVVTRLDDYNGEHRNHDLVVIGRAAGGDTLLAIEAKADEPFGNHTVAGYLKLCERREEARLERLTEYRLAGRPLPRASNADRRITELCAALFGPAETGKAVAKKAKPLRYQLIAALAGTLIEARAKRCGQAVLVVQEFLSSPDPTRESCGTKKRKVERNIAAWYDFEVALTGNARDADERLAGPVRVPGNERVPSDIPCLLGKTSRHLN